MNTKLTLAEKHKEINRIFSRINNNQTKGYDKLKTIFTESVYFMEHKADFYRDILNKYLVKGGDYFTQQLFYHFFCDQLENDNNSCMTNIFIENDFATARLFHQYFDVYYADNSLLKLLNKNGYFNKFNLTEYFDFIDNYTLHELHQLHDVYFQGQEEKELINFVFDFLSNDNINTNQIKKIYPLVEYLLDNNKITQDSLINFILDSSLINIIKLEVIGIYSSSQIISDNKNKIISLIADDPKFIKNHVNRDLLNILRRYDKNIQLIDAGLYLTRLNIFIQEHEQSEAIKFFKQFKKDFPNLYESLYHDNKKIQKSPNPVYKSFIEKIHISIAMEGIENKNINIKKRL